VSDTRRGTEISVQENIQPPGSEIVRKGDSIRLKMEKAAFEGKSVARHGGLVVFVEGAVPGDVADVRIFKKKRDYAEGRAVEIVLPSTERVEPKCGHFGICGGCSWQNLAYEAQLQWKREHVREAFERIGGLGAVSVRETLAAERQFFYRNKMEYSFGESRWLLQDEMDVDLEEPAFALGLHVPGRFDKILHIDECMLQSQESNAILSATRSYFLANGGKAFSTRNQSGELRNLVIREAKATGERMVFLVTGPGNSAVMDGYASVLRDPALGVTTFVHGVTSRLSSVALADSERVFFGDGHITERLGGNVFRISPSSFFQTNTAQAERLYGLASDFAGSRPDDVLWDLYCGTGTISLFLARSAGEVLGVELNGQAVSDARQNAAANGIDNANFIVADISAFLKERKSHNTAPDVVILDPPRAGLHPDAARMLGEILPPKIVYVSCNPATCARDCSFLAGRGYNVVEIAPVDMFPQTYHIECVVLLERVTGLPTEAPRSGAQAGNGE